MEIDELIDNFPDLRIRLAKNIEEQDDQRLYFHFPDEEDVTLDRLNNLADYFGIKPIRVIIESTENFRIQGYFQIRGD